MYHGLDNVGVAVADIDEALGFYETLGFDCEPHSETDARVTPGVGAYLYVFEPAGGGEVGRDDDLGSNPVGIDHVSIRVDDVDEVYETLRERGVEFLLESVTEEAWRLRMATTRDPSGNVFYFVASA